MLLKRRAGLPMLAALSVLVVVSGSSGRAWAQQASAPQSVSGAPLATESAKQAAPIDLSGHWVSLVTTDWRWRMVTPPRGDYQSVPINEAAYEMALKWDPAKDEAAGEQCKSYGAAALMAVPGRLHITWQDEQTLQIQTDAGMQTRLLHFVPSSAAVDAPASWQGQSTAVWEINSSAPADPIGTAGVGGPGPGAVANNDHSSTQPPPIHRSGSLKVVTTNLLPGYLRKNGIPYSAQTRVTEYWDLLRERDGTPLIVITSIVHDPMYLQQDWITALQFEKESNGSKWDPQPCSARW